ncbi:Pectate lyase superfamily protein [Desulfocurvibacter africanus PCS]|uniref:Pectate lyase superfamily protein n=1 Tax=Desulfocurvibacter africanus PCS TaxID=1262666 RepID=M5Q389_DESAF|nr:right-handed parallel beta-helix repeat-containing protein [Desulfocurvibacter africanus]EMG39151.1 Pectate lyase superfamily protein [Desulfocurvibacter africanus PCS]
MPALFSNNASARLAAEAASWHTTLTLESGQGALFPQPDADLGEWFAATLADASGTLEIVRVTARQDDALTVERGQEGTIPSPFAANDLLELRPTAASLDGFVQREELEPDRPSRLKGAWFVAADSDILDHGDATVRGSLAWVLAQVGAARAEVSLPGGHTYVVRTSLSVPDNVTLVVGRGAVLDLALNVVLTLDCDLRAGAQAVFAGSGSVEGRMGGRAVLPHWWGARGDGATDDSEALGKALAFPAVRFPAGTYLVSRSLALSGHSALMGAGLPAAFMDWETDWQQEKPGYASRASVIQYKPGSHGALFDPADHVSFSGLVFRCGQVRTVDDAFLSGPASHLVLDGCRFENLESVAVDPLGSTSFGAMRMDGCIFVGCGTVLQGALVDCRISGCVFTTCDLCIDTGEGSGFNLVTGNRFEWNKQAVRVYRGRANVLSSNIFDASEKAAILLHQAKDQLVQGNIFWRNGRGGSEAGNRSHIAVLESCADNVIRHNTFLRGAPDGGEDAQWPRFVLEFISAPATRTVFTGNAAINGCLDMPVYDAWWNSQATLIADDVHIRGIGNPGQDSDQLIEMLKRLAFVADAPVNVHLYEDRRFTVYTDLTADKIRLVGHDNVTLTDTTGQAHSLLEVENLAYGPSFLGRASAMRASSAPTLGYWRHGSLVWNTAPGVGQPLGWVCTAAGSPGTWVGFATLA